MEREAVQEGRQLCLRHGGAGNASQLASHLYSVNPEFKKMFQKWQVGLDGILKKVGV